MTTDIIVRKAENILDKNEIADFYKLDIYNKPASAISVEFHSNNKTEVLSKILNKLFPNHNLEFFALLEDQPDNRVTRYKKGWGLLESRGNFNSIRNKMENMKESKNRLNFFLLGEVDTLDVFSLGELIELGGRVFFSIGKKNNNRIINEVVEQYYWISDNLNSGNTIAFFLDLNFESSKEIVLMSSCKDILKLDNFNFLYSDV